MSHFCSGNLTTKTAVDFLCNKGQHLGVTSSYVERESFPWRCDRNLQLYCLQKCL